MVPFKPLKPTIQISVTGASLATELVGGADAVRVEVGSVGTVYIAFGVGTDTVTTANGMGVMANSVETFGVPTGATHILTIGAVSTLRVTQGVGM